MSTARLKVIRETTDGFRIAEEDLKLRGEGDVLGIRQSGLPGYRIARPEVHGQLIAQARDEALRIMKDNPKLKGERGEALRCLLYLYERDEARAADRGGMSLSARMAQQPSLRGALDECNRSLATSYSVGICVDGSTAAIPRYAADELMRADGISQHLGARNTPSVSSSPHQRAATGSTRHTPVAHASTCRRCSHEPWQRRAAATAG